MSEKDGYGKLFSYDVAHNNASFSVFESLLKNKWKEIIFIYIYIYNLLVYISLSTSNHLMSFLKKNLKKLNILFNLIKSIPNIITCIKKKNVIFVGPIML